MLVGFSSASRQQGVRRYCFPMVRILAPFWLRRFGLVFGVAFLCLLGVPCLSHPINATRTVEGCSRRKLKANYVDGLRLRT